MKQLIEKKKFEHHQKKSVSGTGNNYYKLEINK